MDTSIVHHFGVNMDLGSVLSKICACFILLNSSAAEASSSSASPAASPSAASAAAAAMKPSVRTDNWSKTRRRDQWRCACSDEDDSDHYCQRGDDFCVTNTSCFTSIQWKGHYEVKKGCSSTLHCPTQTSIINLQCCYSDMCNNNVTMEYPGGPQKEQKCDTEPCGLENPLLIAYIFIPMLITMVILGFAMVICHMLHKRRMRRLNHGEAFLDGELKVEQCGDSTVQDYLEHSTTGSGSGLPLLIQRTVARQITLTECIGKGRYGEVWRGVYHGENMAVKIFSSRDERSWERESQIYNTVLLRHDNILGFLASDLTSKNGCTQLWLITQYHPYGSLYDYLNKHALSHEAMLVLAHSSSAGLVHLHTELIGSHSKHAIAHRDIKSKNILVKADGTCCIADLGLAVTHSQRDNVLDLGSNTKVGTKRYMAPEILDETLNTCEFDSFKRADVYSFGLVLWELARRCTVGGVAEDYNPPYFNMVPGDPSYEDMRKVICVQQERPPLSNRWSTDITMSQFSRMMRESWHQNPNTRLTMLRIKKSLAKMLRKVRGLSTESV